MRPTLFHLGPFPVHSFGVMVLAAFLLGLWYTLAQARKRMAGHDPEEPGVITPEHVFDFALTALFVCIIAARVLYVALDLNEFQGRWTDVFKIWTGGLTVVGSIIIAPFYLWWYCRRHHLSFLSFADLCAPGFALGNAIGRIGCLLNGCCYGAPCTLPWAVRFADEHHPGLLTPPSHPTQIYETLMNLASFALLHFWSKRPHKRGEIMLGFFGLYCVTRFVSEQFRKGATADVPFHFGPVSLTDTQLFCAIVLPILLFALYRLRRTGAAEPSPVPREVPAS
jgi:phosphatidylglycerol:prolipoprotein diacylglycerol transferase